MNSEELIARIRAQLRRKSNTLDMAYDSGLLSAIWIISESAKSDLPLPVQTGVQEYCPRCAEIAKLFEKRDLSDQAEVVE